MRSWTLLTGVGVAAVALVAASATAVVQWQRADAAEQRADELSDEVADLRDEIERLEEELAPASRPEDADDGDDALEGLLGDLGLEGLLDGTSGIPGAACMVPDDADGLGGLFDDLLGGTATPDDPDELVALIANQVAELRQLEWQEEVEVDFLDDAALRARLDQLLDEDADPEAEDADARLLEHLGAIPAGADLGELQRELLGEAVAGFYVSDTGELVVRVPDDGTIRPLDRVTLAHELEHALADQVLGLPDTSAIDDADARLGALSVIEGDATLLMNLWGLEFLSFADQLAIATSPDIVAAQAALDGVPHFLQEQLLFPYTAGLDFVCELYLEGGWAAVDAAYDDLPTTSAEVVFPDRRGQEPEPAPALTAPAGYDEVRADTFGLAPLEWLFQAPGGDEDRALSSPRQRAAAWAGGELRVWVSGAETAVGAAFVDGGGGPPLCTSVTEWYAAAFPDASGTRSEGAAVFRGVDVDAVVACDDDHVRLAIAPDVTTATRIVGGG